MEHTENDPGESTPMFGSLRRRRGPGGRGRQALLAVLAFVVLVAAGVAWYRLRHRPAPAVSAAPPVADTAHAPRQPVAAALPALDSSDAFVRGLARGLSSHPRVAAWLANRNLIRRFVVAVADVANGQSPATHLEFMAPKGAFKIAKGQGVTRVDPSSYRRYGAVSAAFASLSTDGLAKLYHRVEPLCDQAYKELGLPGTFEDALARAFGRLLAVHVPAAPPELVPHGAMWAYADPHLQGLSPAAKQLVRMGPGNAGRIQTKLKALATAMGIQPQPPERGEAQGAAHTAHHR